MTAQVSDDFIHQQRRFNIAGISEGHLFDPSIFKVRVKPASSACWRGWQADYTLVEQRLVVATLNVNLFDPHHPPMLNGVAGVPSERTYCANWSYALNQPVDYTGGVLIADGFIEEMYVHMGYHPAWKYKQVIELVFKNGELIYEADRSETVAEMRERIMASEKNRKLYFKPDREDIPDFVARTFNQRYKL